MFASNGAKKVPIVNLLDGKILIDDNLEQIISLNTDCGSVAYGVFAVWYHNGASYEQSLEEAQGSYERCNGGSSEGWDEVEQDIEDRWG